MSNDLLRELAKDLPWDRPDEQRRDDVRASLLVAASERVPPARRRLIAIGVAFAAGALAAAAVAIVFVADDRPARPPEPTTLRGAAPSASPARISTSAAAQLEHAVIATATGVDEVVRVRDGAVRLTLGQVRAGDHVRVRTDDAQVEGVGDYEVVVVAGALTAVSVNAGRAQIEVTGQRTVVLAAGQTWRASVITAELAGSIPDAAPNLGETPPARAAEIAPTPRGASDSRTLGIQRARPDAEHAPETPRGTRLDTIAEEPRASRARPGTDGAAEEPRASSARPGTEGAAEEPRASSARINGAAEEPRASRAQPTTDGGRASPVTDPAITSGAAPTPPRSRTPTATERHFQAGWVLLRQGKPAEAAVELALAADAGDQDPLAVDARYFQAVALVGSGQPRAAERVLVAFLDHAPRSLRRGRASVLLAQLITRRGDVASARAWYRSALDDPDPAVAAAARAGIEGLEPRR